MGKGTDEMNEHSTEEIRQEIRHTESEMGETIHAIQEKLSPAHLKQQAQEKATEMANRTAARIRDAVKSKPGMAAAALAGAGAAVYFLVRRKRRRSASACAASRPSCDTGESAECEPARQVTPQTCDARKSGTALGAIALVIGAAAGSCIPTSSGERRFYTAVMETLRKAGSKATESLLNPQGGVPGAAREQSVPMIK